VGTINKTKLENVLQRVDRSIEQDAGANLERGITLLVAPPEHIPGQNLVTGLAKLEAHESVGV
jgi:hypothetical protein